MHARAGLGRIWCMIGNGVRGGNDTTTASPPAAVEAALTSLSVLEQLAFARQQAHDAAASNPQHRAPGGVVSIRRRLLH